MKSMMPVPIMLRTPSTSVMMRATRVPVRFESFRVEVLFGTVATRFADRARGLSRSIVVEPTKEVIEGDRLRLEQALGNLVD